MSAVTVAVPVREGAGVLERTLAAVRGQQLGAHRTLELLVCDSGSSDGSVALARSFGAEVIEIGAAEFSHGATRNLLMQRAQGEHVAFLTQDSVPADERWLARLLGGFELAGDVALTFGPYRARPEASPMVARELADWFTAFAPDRSPRVDRLESHERQLPTRVLLGPRGFFTDANGCVARAAWQEVPFRPVAYAEDHVLAHDMLRAGYAKVFVPEAEVIHSHDYPALGWLRRSFDEARALREIYGFAAPAGLKPLSLGLWGKVRGDWRWAGAHGIDRSPRFVAGSAAHHALRMAGALLGGRAERLPAGAVARLSLEGRGR